MATLAPGRYALKSLHEEIGLFDRKLAHLLKYGEFATDSDRKAAATKMANKRDQLVRAAQQMAAEGIEFKPSELPPSLRPAGSEAHLDEVAAVPETAEPIQPAAALAREAPVAHLSPLSDEIREYIKNRRKH